MIDGSENSNINFDDFIEIDENLDCSELSLGLLCFEEDTKQFRVFCKHPKTGKLGWAKLIENEVNKMKSKRNTIFKEVAKVLADYPDWQIFSTKNTAGDPMKTIYCKNGIRIDMCYKFEYLEVLTENGEPVDDYTWNSIEKCLEEITKQPKKSLGCSDKTISEKSVDDEIIEKVKDSMFKKGLNEDSTMSFLKAYIKEKEALVSQKELDELSECFNFDEYDEIYDLVNNSLEILEKSIYDKENLELKKLHKNLLRLKDLI